MKLKGRRILLTKPVRKESTIKLSGKEEAEIEASMMRSWTALEVFAIGDSVESVAVGDKVYIPSGALKNCEVVEVDSSVKLMLQEGDVAIIW